MGRYRSFGGMTWPNPNSIADISWRLRYARGQLTESEMLVAASVVDAYIDLIRKTSRERAMVVRNLKAHELDMDGSQ